jgi:hypothetical protein
LSLRGHPLNVAFVPTDDDRLIRTHPEYGCYQQKQPDYSGGGKKIKMQKEPNLN